MTRTQSLGTNLLGTIPEISGNFLKVYSEMLFILSPSDGSKLPFFGFKD